MAGSAEAAAHCPGARGAGDVRCILWGGYAGGNVGDELTLAVALADARARHGDAVAVLSGQPEYTRWLFPDAQVIHYTMPLPPLWQRALRRACGPVPGLADLIWRSLPRYPLTSVGACGDHLDWAGAIRRAERLYLVGGGYLTDLFAIDYATLPLRVAVAAGVPVDTAPLGLGPFHCRNAAAAVAAALGGAKLTVRDDDSLAFCHAHGLATGLRPDDGYRVGEVLADLEARPPAPREAGPRVGVCMFDQHGADLHALDAWWEGFLRALREAAPALDLEAFCFHLAQGEDFASAVRLLARCGWDVRRVRPPAPDFRQALHDLRRYDLVVSTRFHSIVLAQVFDIPHVAVASDSYYRAKMESALGMGCAGRPAGRLIDPATDSPADVARGVLEQLGVRVMDVRYDE